jgi:hypothetical protein
VASRCARLLRRVAAHPLPAPAVEPITLITSSTSRRFSLCSKRSTSRSVPSSNFASSLKLGFIALKLSCVSFFVATRGFFASSRSRAHRSMTLPLATEDDMVAARWRRRRQGRASWRASAAASRWPGAINKDGTQQFLCSPRRRTSIRAARRRMAAPPFSHFPRYPKGGSRHNIFFFCCSKIKLKKISNAPGDFDLPKARKAYKVCKCPAGAGLGSRLALKRAPKGAGGFGARAPVAHRVGHGAVAAPVPGVRSSWAWATATGRASGLHPPGVHLVLMIVP